MLSALVETGAMVSKRQSVREFLSDVEDEMSPDYYMMSFNEPLINTVFGPYEIPIVALWVGGLARSWRAAHMSSR